MTPVWNPFFIPRLRNLKLRKKFTILFLAIFFIPFGLLTFFSLSMSKGMIQQNTSLHLQNLVEVKETAIEQWIQERISDGKILTNSGEIRSLDPQKIEPLLNFKRGLHRAYRELLVADMQGREISRRSPPRTLDKEDWFQQAVAKGLYISPPTRPRDSGGPLLIVSLLIQDERGRPVGVLKELIEMDYVAQLIFEPHLGETGKLLLANLRGEIILHERQSEITRKGIFRVPYFDHFQFQPTYTGVYEDPQGNEVLGAWKWIPGLQCYLMAEQDTREAFQQIRQLTERALIIFGISTLVILLVAYWAVGTVIQPIRQLGETVESFAEGKFDKAMVVDRKDEVGKLVEGFTQMAAKLRKAHGELEGRVKASNTELEKAYYLLKQRQEQLIRSEKMAALGQLSAGVAHEIRNPLTSIKIFIQTLEKEIDLDENQQEDFRIIRKEIDRLNEIVVRFLNFARPEEPQLQPVNLYGLMMDTLNLLMARIKGHGIRLNVSLSPDLPLVEGDPKQLDQVLLNLLLNAVEAMPNGGTLGVHSAVKTVPETEGKVLQLVIQDTGPGIREQDRAYLFDPFFTTKDGGTGMGLSIAYSIIQKHKGQIEVESQEGQGASFILSLPLPQEEPWKKSSS
jgi:two-component system, NtrC family, sensor kinase